MIKKKEKIPATSTYRKHADSNSCWLANTLLDGWSDPESEDRAPCCSFQQQTQERVEQAFFLYLRLCLNLKQLKKKTIAMKSRKLSFSLFGRRNPRSSLFLSTQVTLRGVSSILLHSSNRRERGRDEPSLQTTLLKTFSIYLEVFNISEIPFSNCNKCFNTDLFHHLLIRFNPIKLSGTDKIEGL